jgi:hypothetical protein
MRLYWCDLCGFTTPDVTLICLMPDGETEYCIPCDEKQHVK